MIGKLRALASDLIARNRLANQAGITYSGDRDLFAALGYKRDLLPKDYRDRYERNAIAGRIVEALPKATWRNGAELVEDEDPDTETAFEEAFSILEDRLKVWMMMMRVDVLAGLGQFGVMLIGAPGKLEEELPKMSSQENILYLSVFGEEEVEISRLENDTENPRFGQPVEYTFDRLSPSTSTGMSISFGRRKVHWTRVLHVADGILDQQIYGEPRLKRCWNLLDDLEKVTGGGSEAFWARIHRGLQLDLEKDVEMNETEMQDLQDEVDEYIHGMRRFIRTRGLDIKELGGDVAAFNQQVDAIITLISGGTGIPKRILVGSEMGELASTQDRTNWHERVEDRRVQYGEPQMIRPFVDRLIEYGALPTPTDYDVRWPNIAKMDEEQKANIADKLAGLNSKAGDTVITAGEIRDRILELPPIEEVIDVVEEIPTDEPTEFTDDQLKQIQSIVNPVPTENLPTENPEEPGAPVVARGKKASKTLIIRRKRNLGRTFIQLPTDIQDGCKKRLN